MVDTSSLSYRMYDYLRRRPPTVKTRNFIDKSVDTSRSILNWGGAHSEKQLGQLETTARYLDIFVEVSKRFSGPYRGELIQLYQDLDPVLDQCIEKGDPVKTLEKNKKYLSATLNGLTQGAVIYSYYFPALVMVIDLFRKRGFEVSGFKEREQKLCDEYWAIYHEVKAEFKAEKVVEEDAEESS